MTDGTELYSLNENVWVKLYGVKQIQLYLYAIIKYNGLPISMINVSS